MVDEEIRRLVGTVMLLKVKARYLLIFVLKKYDDFNEKINVMVVVWWYELKFVCEWLVVNVVVKECMKSGGSCCERVVARRVGVEFILCKWICEILEGGDKIDMNFVGMDYDVCVKMFFLIRDM